MSDRLAAGAHHVQLVTAAMLNPRLGITLRGAIHEPTSRQ
jgi:hypothetical protein